MLARFVAGGWAVVIVAAMIASRVSPAWRDSLTTGGPTCPFLRMTGQPCPFCGMTRASLAMANGEWDAAFGFHPLAPFVLAGVLAILALIALGKAGTLLDGRRPFYLLGSILAVWALRFLL